METLYLFNYNNYYNRIKKPKYDTVSDYVTYGNLLSTTAGCSFNTNDGVTASFIVNYSSTAVEPDYAIVADKNFPDTPLSRWFVMDMVRTRNGQYKINLRRDVIADYIDEAKDSPCFIEKASLNLDNPLIFNQEEMTFNQIKKQNNLLKDSTNVPWIVLYLAQGDRSSLSGTVNTNENFGAIELNTTLNNWELYNYVHSIDGEAENTSNYWAAPSLNNVSLVGKLYNEIKYYKITYSPSTNSSSRYNSDGALSPVFVFKQGIDSGTAASRMKSYYSSNPSEYATLSSYAGNHVNYSYHDSSDIESFVDLQGKTIKTSDGHYYLIDIVQTNRSDTYTNIKSGLFYNKATTDAKTALALQNYAYSDPPQIGYQISTTSLGYYIELVERTDVEITWDLTSTTKLTTLDAPYDLVAIPYGSVTIDDTVTSEIITTFGENYAVALANAIISKGSGNNALIYDAQLLPYFPGVDMIEAEGVIQIENAKQISYVTKDSDKIGAIIYLPYSKFTFNINYTISPAESSIGRKINNQCDLWRLCSPNYSNYFEFNVEKNNGIEYFNVDCEYKPFTPYIHINPNFKSYYGEDFNTPLGLICGGDFSLTLISDQWETYTRQNKNFQLSFDRTIQNMEVNNKYQRTKEIIGGIAGAGTGAAAGAAVGSMIMPGAGTAIGALAGGLISGGAAAADVAIGDALRKEAIDYTKDQFNYQLGNIQALPITLSKVSAYNPNNQIWPVLEYYTCTDAEKEYFAQKLKYNGMTTMVISKLSDYLLNTWTYTVNGKTINNDKPYVKGKLIRSEDINLDYHILNELALEIDKGFFYGG